MTIPYKPGFDCRATPAEITAACATLAEQIAEGRGYIALPLSAHAVLVWTEAEACFVYIQIDQVEYQVELYSKDAAEIEAELKRILK